MPHPTSGLTLDASGVLASRLLDSVASKRPSAQEKLGDRLLDRARDLAQKNGDWIRPFDLKIARDKVLYAAEIKAGLESKNGLSKYLQAREYKASAKEALRFIKTIGDSAVDEVLGQRTLGLNPMLTTTDGGVDIRLFAEMKPNVTSRVEHLYHFKMSKAPESIRFNIEHTKMLLRDMNFIYPEPRDAGKRHSPYSHPIIQEAINVTLFCNKDDVGVVYHEHFSPMPIPIIALMLAVVQCCIDEWSDGQRRDSDWDEDKVQAVYSSHVSSLFNFQANGLERNIDLLGQLQFNLLRNAREHAGVPPYPLTEPGGCFEFTPPCPPSPIQCPDPEPNAVNPNKKTTQLARKSSTGPPTQEQPQHPESSSSERTVFPLPNATPAVLGRPTSLQIAHEPKSGPDVPPLELTGVNSKPRLVPEDDVSESPTEYDGKFAAPHPPSEGETTRLELGRQLSVSLATQMERDQRTAQLTDELALKSSLLEQAEASDVEAATGVGPAGPELREHADDRRLTRTPLAKRRDAEPEDMQARLRDIQAKLDELLLSRDHYTGQYEKELANMRAKVEANESELKAIRLRLMDAENGLINNKEEDTLYVQIATGSMNRDEDQVTRRLVERVRSIEIEMASKRWNEKSIEEMECRNEG